MFWCRHGTKVKEPPRNAARPLTFTELHKAELQRRRLEEVDNNSIASTAVSAGGTRQRWRYVCTCVDPNSGQARPVRLRQRPPRRKPLDELRPPPLQLAPPALATTAGQSAALGVVE